LSIESLAKRLLNESNYDRKENMKYMLLIYSDENAWTQNEMEQCYTDSVQLTQELNAKGQYLGAR
jgi:hypothetical protein